MIHDIKPIIPLSPSKGKAREKYHWQADWWDFQSLGERINRPLEWSQSSIIFTAHPTQPSLIARHFSSSKQFVIPSPAPIISSPGSYQPPTVISVAPGDDWLFAYFPRCDNDGTGCLWKRGAQIDKWDVKEWWNFAHGAGVVTASWLGTPREWVTDTLSSSLVRLPPSGPPTPMSTPTLFLVTQDHLVKVYYFQHHTPSLQVMSCSIPHLVEDREINGMKHCFKAAIGLGYNASLQETSILIATRSYSLPSSLTNSSQLEKMDSALSDELNQQSPSEMVPTEWECCGEETTINLTEVQFKFNGNLMSLTAEPLSPILNTYASLTSLKFIIIPPSFLGDPDPQKPLSPKKNDNERGKFYLASTYIDFGDYTSTPSSELALHIISRQTSSQNSNSGKPTWISHKSGARAFNPGVLTFVAPSVALSGSSHPLIYAGIVDTFGYLPKSSSKTKEFPIGVIKVLNLPDLTEKNDWEASPILTSTKMVGYDLPLNAAVSPNGILLCTISQSLCPTQTSIRLLPRAKNHSAQSPPLAAALSSAILSRKSAADITHVLALPSTPIAEVMNTLYATIHILGRQPNGSSYPITLKLLGEIMFVYKKRAGAITKDHGDNDDLVARWKTAHDMCSLAACNTAFEDAKDGETYDLDIVWQLIALSTWIVTFTESIMKECVLYSRANTEVKAEFHDDLSVSSLGNLTPSLDSPTLLHLVHPFALKTFSTALLHIKQYRAYLGSLSARGENAQIARDVLMDLVDNSGVDFTALGTLLDTSIQDVQALDKDCCQRALASCWPVPAMWPHLSKIIKQVTQPTILNKFMLFIKPSDLIDGVSRLSVAPSKNKDRDVVSKQLLAQRISGLTCLHCGSHSQIGKEFNAGASILPRWKVWEKMWTFKCICGGYWINDS